MSANWFHHPFVAAARQQADEVGIHSIWEWIEGHSLVAYPVMALSILLLIGGALVASWRSQAMSAEQKSQLKGKIMAIMRRRVSGVSPEAVAAELQIEVLAAASLLNELAEEGVVATAQSGSATDAARYRIKGVN
jgi:hypothetical protein